MNSLDCCQDIHINLESIKGTHANKQNSISSMFCFFRELIKSTINDFGSWCCHLTMRFYLSSVHSAQTHTQNLTNDFETDNNDMVELFDCMALWYMHDVHILISLSFLFFLPSFQLPLSDSRICCANFRALFAHQWRLYIKECDTSAAWWIHGK